MLLNNFAALREPVCLDQLFVSGSGMLAYVGREIVWVHIKNSAVEERVQSAKFVSIYRSMV